MSKYKRNSDKNGNRKEKVDGIPKDCDDLLKRIELYKSGVPHGNEPMNNRSFDILHVFKDSNENRSNVIKIDSSFYRLFSKKECWYCSGNKPPRPMDCYGSEYCHFYCHTRNKGFVMETVRRRVEKTTGKSINLSRCNLSFLLNNQWIEMIIRTLDCTNWVFHHTIDEHNDTPNSIKIVSQPWHGENHGTLVGIDRTILKIENLILKETDPKKIELLKIRLDSEIVFRNKQENILRSVDDDPLILKVIFELNERFKKGLL